MRSVSIGFLEEIVRPSRTVDAKIVINGYTITSNDIISYEITSSLTDNDMPTIGSAVASSVKFEVTKSSLPMIYVGQKLEFYAGLLVNGAMEWVRVGTFKTTAEYVNKKKLTVEIEAFDEMFWLGNTIYESDLSYPTTVATMMSELVTKYGLVFSSDMYAFEERRTHESMEAFTYGQLEAYWYQPRITDDIVFHIDPTQQEYSIRSILSQMALLTSSNVVVDSFGEIAFRFLRPTAFEITGENYVDYTRLSEGDIYISQLISKNPELEQTFVSGANTGVAITVENSGIVSQVQNDDIRNRVYPLTYTPYSMTCQGMPHLEIGDTVRFVEVDDTESVLFIVNYSFEYNGGFRNKFTVKSPEKDNVETTPFRSASSTVSGETIRLTNQNLEQAIANASELITGNQGGHVVTIRDEVTGKPQEILILVDSDDVNTATKLWRWNAGGLGFSNTGYNGTYELAMTSDGKIVADAINASELSTITANLGIVTTGKLISQDGTVSIDLSNNAFKIGKSAEHTENSSKYIHTDGSYTQIGVNGLERVVAGVKNPYKYLTYGNTILKTQTYSTNITFDTTLPLPSDFAGKNPNVFIFLESIKIIDETLPVGTYEEWRWYCYEQYLSVVYYPSNNTIQILGRYKFNDALNPRANPSGIEMIQIRASYIAIA